LKASNMTAGENHGTAVYQDNVLAWMHVDGKPEMPGPWTIWPDLETLECIKKLLEMRKREIPAVDKQEASE